MNKTLKEIFDNAWCDMEVIYNTGAICSERHMQCELFRLLKNDETFNRNYQVFVEPCLRNHGHKMLEGKIPDMVISDKEKKIIAAVELKYTPHSWPKYQKDIDTLIEFWTAANPVDKPTTFKLQTDIKTGQWDEFEFSVSQELKLIYCIITQADAYIVTNNFDALQQNNNKIWSDEGFKNYYQYVGAINEKGWMPANK